VIHRLFLRIKAVFILCMGMAFFVAACQPRSEIRNPPEAGPDLALYSAAQAEYMAGHRSKALEDYNEYVQRNPRGQRAGDALYRMAKIYEEDFEYERAMALYQKIAIEYPDYPDAAEVSLDRANILYRLGRYTQSRDEALQWLRSFPASPLSGQVFLLLGKSEGALGNGRNAFAWFLRASAAFPVDDPLEKEIDSYVRGLLEKADMAELKEMSADASGSKYLPLVYDRMASLSLETDDLDAAREAAMALVRSTPDQYWVDRGRKVLERVSEERAVRKGVIGCLLPLTGPFAIYGQEVLNGIQLGIGAFGASDESQNAEILIEDTQGDPDVTVTKVEELVHKDHVMGIIGPLARKTATAAAKEAQQLGVPIITLTQKEGITEEGDMVFRNSLTPAREMDRLVSEAVRGLGMSRFGILYPDSAYGRYLLNLFWDRVEEEGGSITAVESYPPQTTDFSEQIKKMVGLYYPRPPAVEEKLREAKLAANDAGPEMEANTESKEPEPIVDFDAVFIPDNYQKVALIAPQFPFHNVFGVRFLGTSLWQSPDLLAQGADYLQGAIIPSGFFGETEKAFVDLYKENYDSEPGILAAIGYDSVRFLAHVMKAESVRTRRDLQQALLLSRNYKGIRGPLSFDGQREVTTLPTLLTIQGKKFLPLP
jgi:ABC-type branched-subunit amino acid transport system substrate-binding protein/outer membrane protein assembly factor BamD (BamD/ComL family)